MGVVYEALDRELGARVALKKLRNFSAEALVRFKNEFRALQDVHHPNLVHLGELISEGNDWLFTMELVEGCDVLEYVRRGARTDFPSSAAVTAKLEAADAPTRSSRRADSTPALSPSESIYGSDATVAGPVERAPAFDPNDPPAFDEHRLRHALRQIAEGLCALHEAGLVHRDIKPSNIRVTPEGRVIVLDFGLVAESGLARPSATMRLDGGDRQGPDDDEGIDFHITGTPAYMAPEQVTDESLEPSADWYALGVLLYQALTGTVPFRGPALYVLQRKLNADAAPARRMAPGVPPDLDDLCAALLQRDPRARPTGVDILRRLSIDGGGRAAATDSLASHASHAARPQDSTFVGRATELLAIARAFVDVQRRGAPISVVVQGESGVGKSRLVRRFLDGVRQDAPGTLVLVGRCYERESVPYKAFDGVIDTLARELARRADDQVAALLPADLAAIVHVFPVLQGLPAAAPLSDRPAMDPIELRQRAFGALRELLARLTKQAPVIVTIDDVQWADDDSRALVADVLRPPDAPRLLLVVTLRSSGGAGEEAARSARFAEALPGDVRRVDIAGLAPGDARELAARLLERAGMRAAESAAVIAREAEGHPLFIDALVRHDAMRPGDLERAVHLEEALWSRIAPLDAPPRAILDVLAVSGGPTSRDVLQRAVADRLGGRECRRAEPSTDVARWIAPLRFAHLVQTAGARGTDRVDVYHDRVRAAVLAHLGPRERQGLHHLLARSLELAGTADAEALATHWRGAGNFPHAAKYAHVAGDRAAAALAFDRAAHFYELAVSLGKHPDGEARLLHTKLGDALANVGRAARAASAYQRAAHDAPAATALDLRRRAAEQLLRGGHFDDGLAEIRGVLASIGMSLPSTPRRAFLLLVLLRAILRLRGLSFRERDESQIAPRDLTRIDVCSSAATGLGLIDTIRAAALQSRHILLALRAGEPVRVARALALETINIATGGGATWRRTEALMARAEAMAERTGRRDVVGLAMFSRGFVHYMNGKFRRGFELLDESHRIMRNECAGMSFETVSAQWAMLNCLTYLGELDELRARRPVYLREAAARGDLYGVVNLRLGPGNMAWLVTDDVDEAREEVADAMKRWSKQGFHIEHFNALFARVGVELYAGRGAEAFDLVMRDWPAIRSSVFLSIQIVRIVARIMRGLAAIAAAEARPASQRSALVTIARRDARRLEGENVGWAAAQSRVLRTGVALLASGDRERARTCLEQAATMFDANGMALHATAARRRLGRLLGGAQGSALENEATAWMTARGVRDPSRMTALIVPGADVTR
jgi:serine/threonine protein kinase/tetratricopeptide (TPR) repeat protein